MDQRGAQQMVRHVLGDYGFRPVHESSAVILLEHPSYPGVRVRMGTTRVIVERDNRECYRSRITDFDLDALLACIAISSDSDDFSESDRA